MDDEREDDDYYHSKYIMAISLAIAVQQRGYKVIADWDRQKLINISIASSVEGGPPRVSDLIRAVHLYLKTRPSRRQWHRWCERLMSPSEFVKQQQSETLRNYAATFVKIGRRDGFCCAHCGKSPKDLAIDHIVPLSSDGESKMSNYQLLCRSCNSRKGPRMQPGTKWRRKTLG